MGMARRAAYRELVLTAHYCSVLTTARRRRGGPSPGPGNQPNLLVCPRQPTRPRLPRPLPPSHWSRPATHPGPMSLPAFSSGVHGALVRRHVSTWRENQAHARAGGRQAVVSRLAATSQGPSIRRGGPCRVNGTLPIHLHLAFPATRSPIDGQPIAGSARRDGGGRQDGKARDRLKRRTGLLVVTSLFQIAKPPFTRPISDALSRCGLAEGTDGLAMQHAREQGNSASRASRRRQPSGPRDARNHKWHRAGCRRACDGQDFCADASCLHAPRHAAVGHIRRHAGPSLLPGATSIPLV